MGRIQQTFMNCISYCAKYDAMNYVQARALGVEHFRLPSEATFSSTLAVVYFFGIPRWVKPGGLMMDVTQNVMIAVAADGDSNKEVQFMLASGMNSSELEHAVPEQLFSTPDNPSEGISAVKALKIADDQGIPIFIINQSNINSVLPQLQLSSDVITDIQNVVNAGKVVTVSKTNISFNGWNGCGYIIIDPATGNGAYRISGGANGAYYYLLLCVIEAILNICVYAGYVAGGLLAAIYLAPVIAAIEGVIASIVAAIEAATLWSSAWVSVGAFYAGNNAIGAFLALVFATLWACIKMLPPPSLPSMEAGDCAFLVISTILSFMSWKNKL